MEGVIVSALASFFKGKKILITGHTGFKGAWLCQILTNFGAEVFGYALAPNTEPNLYSILKINGKLEEKIADIRHYKTLNDYIQKTKPQIVIHMAAQPLVRDSYDDPLYTFETNVMGTANVLEAIRHCNSIKSAVIVTTDKVYENENAQKPFCESDRLGGHDPYSSSKVCAEFVTDCYSKSFLNKKTNPGSALVASARAGNVIGGGDWSKDRLIPDIIRAQQLNKTLILRNPGAIRPWQHAFDPLFGYLILSKKLYEQSVSGERTLSSAYNFAPEESNFITVKDIVKKSGANFQIQQDKTKHEMKTLKLDSKKAKQELGWEPKLKIDDVLNWTFEWYEKQARNEDMVSFTDGQIEKYLSL